MKFLNLAMSRCDLIIIEIKNPRLENTRQFNVNNKKNTGCKLILTLNITANNIIIKAVYNPLKAPAIIFPVVNDKSVIGAMMYSSRVLSWSLAMVNGVAIALKLTFMVFIARIPGIKKSTYRMFSIFTNLPSPYPNAIIYNAGEIRLLKVIEVIRLMKYWYSLHKTAYNAFKLIILCKFYKNIFQGCIPKTDVFIKLFCII